MKYPLRQFAISAFGSVSCAFATPSLADTTFGIFDARTMAMGGASVASANNDNAQFYNSSLLAFNRDIEERTQDGRFLLPILIPQGSKSAIDLVEVVDDDPILAISDAVETFNELADSQNAQSVVDASAAFDATLASLDEDDLFGDIYVGMAVSEPGKFQGAGFFLGTRLIAAGQTTISPADRQLLSDYQEALTFVATNGAQGAAHPELFDVNGALIDPDNNFDSTVTAAGAAITEAGVAMSRHIQIFGLPLAAGISFKVQRFETFNDVERTIDDRIDVDRNSETDFAFNVDIGFAKDIGDHWRLGLAIKDAIPADYDLTDGSSLRFRPRPRFGVAYSIGQIQLAADLDLMPNESLSGERTTQELAIGAEWRPIPNISLRGGFRTDAQSNRDATVSVGVGTTWRRLAVDFAYAEGADSRGAALQFGVIF